MTEFTVCLPAIKLLLPLDCVSIAYSFVGNSGSQSYQKMSCQSVLHVLHVIYTYILILSSHGATKKEGITQTSARGLYTG